MPSLFLAMCLPHFIFLLNSLSRCFNARPFGHMHSYNAEPLHSSYCQMKIVVITTKSIEIKSRPGFIKAIISYSALLFIYINVN